MTSSEGESTSRSRRILEEINWNARSDYKLFILSPEPAKLDQKKKKKSCSLFCCKSVSKEEVRNRAMQYPDGRSVAEGEDGLQEGTLSDPEEFTGINEGKDKNNDGLVRSNPRRTRRRSRVPDRPNYSLSLWSILKSAIGKDLSKIPIPVNFSEPLSMLQRLTEDFEYSEILDAAGECDNSSEELCMVAAFTVSSYASTAVRTAKPFNPMLGETYECDRTDDKGWKCISEQVRHHPPTAAVYCEGRRWVMWQDFTMKSKFKGNYLEVIPLGIAQLIFTASGNHYSWRKVGTYVHNLVIGKLWVDNEGDMEITNHKTGDKCLLKYHPQTTFGREQKKVTGVVLNKQEVIRWVINGYWDKYIECTEVKEQKLVNGKSDLTLKLVSEYGTPKRLWTRRMHAPQSENYYFLTEFACQLNEPEEGVAPTDSRLRPDQRYMENGKWDEANAEKLRLEDKQRKKRQGNGAVAASSDEDDDGDPIWFKREKDPVSGQMIHKFKQTYWTQKEKGDWSMCPNIF